MTGTSGGSGERDATQPLRDKEEGLASVEAEANRGTEGPSLSTMWAFTSLFQLNMMPFGLCNAPATFQRLMDSVLAGLQWTACLVYMDDIIIPGKTFEHHLHNLSCVFSRLRDAHLKLVHNMSLGLATRRDARLCDTLRLN